MARPPLRLLGDAIIGVFLLGCVCLAYIVFWPSAQARTPALQPDDPDVVALGRDLYAAQCAGCHGANREGGEPGSAAVEGVVPGPPHDASGHTWQHPDHVLFQLTKYGSSDVVCFTQPGADMPVFDSSLTDGEIVAVLSFIKSQWPADIQRYHDEINALYASAE